MYRLLFLGEKTKHHNIAYVWTAVEVNLAIISSSMPALRPLFSRWYPKLFGSNSAKSSNQPYPNQYHRKHSGLGSNGVDRSQNHESHPINYMLRDLNPGRKHAKTEVRGMSPSGSEEEILTYNGILRTTNVNVVYEDAKRSDAGSNVSHEMA